MRIVFSLLAGSFLMLCQTESFSQSITTNNPTGSPYCAGATITVPFTSNSVTFGPGNQFTVQLATDATFTSFVSLTPVTTSTATSGNISATIPFNTASGATYRVRIVSSNPVITGSINGSNITINAPSISVPSFAGTSFCLNNTFNITFTKTCNFSNTGFNNVFTAELSDATGSFSGTTYTLGTLTSVNAGTISATIPPSVPGGTNYRIRIRSSNPATSSPDNGTNLTVVAPPGDPTIFGNGTWNVYAYIGSAFTNYAGYYTEDNINFSSQNRWGAGTSPSNANATSGLAYQGCSITNVSTYSFIYKRTNFTCGYYRIDLPQHDDVVTLIVNGSTAYTAGCCSSNPANAFTGFLGPASTVEIRVQNTGGGNGFLAANFVAAASPIAVSPATTTICSGASTTLTASSALALTYAWAPTASLNTPSGATVIASPTAVGATTYTVTGTDPATGCTASNTAVVNVTAAGSTPVITTTATATTICSGVTTTTITASGANSYTWSPATGLSATTGSTVIANPASTTTYTVTGNNGCNSASTTRAITVQNIPGSPPAPDPAAFGNGVWNVNVYNGNGYTNYYGFYTEANLSFNTTTRWPAAGAPSQATAVTGPPASAGYSGCTVGIPYSMTFKRTNIPCGYYQIDIPSHDDIVTIFINGVQVFTQGYTGAAQSNAWTGFIGPSSNVEIQLINTGGPGNLNITFSPSASTPVNVNSAITVCPSPSNQITLSASSAITGATYAWTSGTPANNGTISSPANATTFAFPNATGNYIATLTDAAGTGCTATASVPVTVNAVAATVVSPTAVTTSCPGTPFTLTASGANSYIWTASPSGATAGLSSTTGFQVTASPTVTTTYTVSGSTNCPPPVDATVTITVNPIPAFTTYPGTTWNVYGFNSQTIGTNYVGYYTDNGTTSGTNKYSFNTTTRWASGTSPATANATNGTAWQGCSMNATNISLSFKRTGFDCGFYQLDVPAHDDDFLLFINGVQVAQHAGCCDSHTNVWTGVLSANSQVEWQVKQGGGGSYLQATFTKLATTQNVWLGGVSTDWFNTANWCSGVPTNTTDVLISGAGPQFMPVIGTSGFGSGAVARNITINGATAASTYSAAIAAASLTTANGFNLDVYGNWTNNGTFTANTGSITFRGTSATLQSTASETFSNFIMNKTSGNTLTITSGTQLISGTMTFTSGVLIQNGILEVLNGGSVTGANNTSFVDGPIIKTGNSAFIFPTGKGSLYRPISISAPTNTTDSYRAQYFNTSPNPTYNNTLKDPSLEIVSGGEYWLLNRIAGTTNLRVTLSWNSNSGTIGNINNLRVAGWNGSTWKDLGNGGTTGSTASGTIISQTSPLVSIFNVFTLASSNLTNPLPVTLTGFTCGFNSNNIPELHWETESETNNDYFIVERSLNGLSFESLGKPINGAGTSKEKHRYSFTDATAPAGIIYYRLKQVDFDGSTSYTEICPLTNSHKQEIRAYPNPVTGAQFEINLNGRNFNSISISDIAQKQIPVVYTIVSDKIVVNASEMDAGIYVIELVLDQKPVILKIAVQK